MMDAQEFHHRMTATWDQHYAALAGRRPWKWSELPGLRGRSMTTRFARGDWVEEFSLYREDLKQRWCRTARVTEAVCSDEAMVRRVYLRLLDEFGASERREARP